MALRFDPDPALSCGGGPVPLSLHLASRAHSPHLAIIASHRGLDRSESSVTGTECSWVCIWISEGIHKWRGPGYKSEKIRTQDFLFSETDDDSGTLVPCFEFTLSGFPFPSVIWGLTGSTTIINVNANTNKITYEKRLDATRDARSGALRRVSTQWRNPSHTYILTPEITLISMQMDMTPFTKFQASGRSDSSLFPFHPPLIVQKMKRRVLGPPFSSSPLSRYSPSSDSVRLQARTGLENSSTKEIGERGVPGQYVRYHLSLLRIHI